MSKSASKQREILYETRVFIDNVKRRMERKKMDKPQLAELTDIKLQHIYSMLAGKGDFSVRTAVRVADALDWPLWKLFRP